MCFSRQNPHGDAEKSAHEHVVVGTEHRESEEDFLSQDVKCEDEIEAQKSDCSSLKVGSTWRRRRHGRSLGRMDERIAMMSCEASDVNIR